MTDAPLPPLLDPLLDALNALSVIPFDHENQFEQATFRVLAEFGKLPDALVGPKRNNHPAPSPGYPTHAEWLARFEALPEAVHTAVWEQALTLCPDCGSRGAGLSWAVTAAESVQAPPGVVVSAEAFAKLRALYDSETPVPLGIIVDAATDLIESAS